MLPENFFYRPTSIHGFLKGNRIIERKPNRLRSILFIHRLGCDLLKEWTRLVALKG